MVRKCALCNTNFTPKNSNQKYCSSECADFMERKRQAEYKLRHNPKTRINKSLNQLANEAINHGMSYGKYVAMLESGKNAVHNIKRQDART